MSVCVPCSAKPANLLTHVSEAFAIGMFQHPGEIGPFTAWVAGSVMPHHVIEIGSWRGGTALLWTRIATGKVVSVDLPNGRFGGADAGLDVEACKRRNAELAKRCSRFIGVLGDSHEAGTLGEVRAILADEPADLLFIDGDHSYEGVRRDFDMYRALVAPGGWVAFHDINETDEHRRVGCEVDRLWRELDGEKVEFNVNGPWGGIGALRVGA